MIEVEDYGFSSPIIFVLYANNIMRRKRITCLSAKKTMSGNVKEALMAFIQASKRRAAAGLQAINDATLQTLLK